MGKNGPRASVRGTVEGCGEHSTATSQSPSATIRSLLPARIDRLTRSKFHTRMSVALGVAWILEHKNTLDPYARAIGDIASVHLIGEVIGALVFGRLSDKFGQARTAQPVRGDPRDLAERADVR